jgi:hypothetical protein
MQTMLHVEEHAAFLSRALAPEEVRAASDIEDDAIAPVL